MPDGSTGEGPAGLNTDVHAGNGLEGRNGAEADGFNAAKVLADWVVDGRFCVSIAYEYFRPKGVKVLWAKSVWNSFVTPKHAFIGWLAIKNKLLTKDRLVFLQIDRRCSFYTHFSKSTAHLFFDCSFSRAVWDVIRVWVGIKRLMSTLRSALKWIKKEGRGTT